MDEEYKMFDHKKEDPSVKIEEPEKKDTVDFGTNDSIPVTPVKIEKFKF